MALKTREKLIEVARQLFANKGVANTTMNDIANASSKGRRTVYTYFKNKIDIYNAVLESESERMVTSLRNIISTDEPVDTRLRKYLRFRIENSLEQTAASSKSWFRFDIRRIDKINRMVSEKENKLLADLLEEGCRSEVFQSDRCELLLGFINQTLNRIELPKPTEYEDGSRERIINNFIEFVVTDISY